MFFTGLHKIFLFSFREIKMSRIMEDNFVFTSDDNVVSRNSSFFVFADKDKRKV